MDSESDAQCTLQNAPPPKHEFDGHQGDIRSFVFLHDNVHIVSGSWDGTMCKWDCDTGLLVGEPWKGEGGRILALELSPDGRTIACGRENGGVQRWNTDGKMIEGVWTGHGKAVRSLSWSPGGSHLASGSEDGTILIRKAKSGKVAVGPIKTDQRWARSLAYSPSGDRIASGGHNRTICIWDSNTGKRIVGPIEDLRGIVTSIVWSSDSSELYSASDEFARVFDSDSGALLHRFPHDYSLWSVALSPEHNVLACVGRGVIQLWDTESYEPLSDPFCQDDDAFHYFVSFSPNGRYLACSGNDNKVTLWMVQDIAPQSALNPNEQEETESSSSCLDVDATSSAASDVADEWCDDPHSNNFFESSHTSPRFSSRGPSHKRRLWNIFLLFRSPESIPLKARLKRSFFARHSQNNDKGKQREEPLTDAETPSHDGHPSPAEFDTNQTRALLKVLIRVRGKVPKKAVMNTHDPPAEVVEVCAARGFKRYVAYKRKDKTKSLPLTTGTSTTAAHAGGSPQAGTSSHGDPALAHASSQAHAGLLSQSVAGHGGQSSQASGNLATYHTNDFSHSDSSIDGAFNKFLDRICFPCGHFYEDT
ncbi:WD40 repeat-like protein [Rhizopogon salebrosus TDB-379]|nr:WD40 repeat-like protein [Rhizopogon salebrosus TDB-379]